MLRIFALNEKNELSEQQAEDMFPFLRSGKHIISLVGAGGKTTMMYELAWLCAAKSLRTLVTTTTKIFEPEEDIYAESEADMKRLWLEGKPAVVGERTDQGKLKMLPEQDLYRYIKAADIIFIEADGARRKPCKVPRDTEPVLLPESDIVLGVAGLDALGHPVEDVCFCIEETKALLGITEEGHRMCPSDLKVILSSAQGTRKDVGERAFYPILNKCDVPEGMKHGLWILKELKNKGIPAACMTCSDQRDT